MKYKQTGTESGRFDSSKPYFSNMPKLDPKDDPILKGCRCGCPWSYDKDGKPYCKDCLLIIGDPDEEVRAPGW